MEHVPRLNFTDICQPRAAILQLTPPLRAAPAQPRPAPVAPLIYRYNQPLLLDSLFTTSKYLVVVEFWDDDAVYLYNIVCAQILRKQNMFARPLCRYQTSEEFYFQYALI